MPENMLKNLDQTRVFEMQMPASWATIANALAEMNRFLAGFHQDEAFLAKTRVVLRELLGNAIKHGNKSEKKQPIFIDAVYLKPNCLRISVKDPGEGFDYRNFGLNKPDSANGMKGRGSYLIRSLTNRIEFNEAGNYITVFLSPDD